MKENLFFVVSGEHQTLPSSEVKAILEAEGMRYRVRKQSFKLLSLEAPAEALQKVNSRSSMCEICGVELFECGGNLEEILSKINEIELSKVIAANQSFAIRVKRAAGTSRNLRRDVLERKIGEAVLGATRNTVVNLSKPDKVFLGILSDGRFVFGIITHARQRGSIAKRRPRRRPVFHPATMPPKLARCMVNLARPKRGQLLLDPFCGVGGILIEAGLVGCRIVGCDIKREMLEGCLRNLEFFRISPAGMAIADARNLPFGHVNCIVADPPYGKSATTLGLTTANLLNSFLNNARDHLFENGFLCLAAPKTVGVSEFARDAGLELVEKHYVYVHRSLTREIAVFRKR